MRPTVNVSSRNHRAVETCSAAWNCSQKQEKEVQGRVWRRLCPARLSPFRMTETEKGNYTFATTFILSVWFHFPRVSF